MNCLIRALLGVLCVVAVQAADFAAANAALYTCTTAGCLPTLSVRTSAGRGHDWYDQIGEMLSSTSTLTLTENSPYTITENFYLLDSATYATNTFTVASTGFLGINAGATLQIASLDATGGFLSFVVDDGSSGLVSGAIHATGDVWLTNAFIDMQGVPAPTGQTFTLIGCDIKDITGLTMSQGWTYTFIEDGANDQLLATAVPEPSTVMLLGLGLAGLVGLGIKRRAKK